MPYSYSPWPDLDEGRDSIPEILDIASSVGEGATNDPAEVESTDRVLRKAGLYERPTAFDNVPVRYIDSDLVGGIKRLQEQNGLISTGRLAAGDDTHHAINNRLLNKPKGFGVAKSPYRGIAAPVGDGKESRQDDVSAVQRSLGALGYMTEHPQDRPHGFIDAATDKGIRAFQADHGLREDGWLGPAGETETAMIAELAQLLAQSRDAWLDYADREATALARAEKARAHRAITPDGTTYVGAENDGSGRNAAGNSAQSHATSSSPLNDSGVRAAHAIPEQDNARVVLAQSTRRPGGVPFPPVVLAEPHLENPSSPRSSSPSDDPRASVEENSTSGITVAPALPLTERELKDYREALPQRYQEHLDWLIVERKGGPDVRAFNEEIRDRVETLASNHKCGADHTGGSRNKKGEEIPERYIPNRDTIGKRMGTKGSSWADISFTLKKGLRRLHINTYDVANRAFGATKREWNAAIRLLYNAGPSDILLLIPKLGPGKTLDWEGFDLLINNILDELCEPLDGAADQRERSLIESLIRVFKRTSP